MTKHTMVTLRLHRSGVILAVIFALVFAVLIFAAGYLVGTRRAPKAKPSGAAPASGGAPSNKTVAEAATATQKQEFVAVRVGMFPAEEDAKALVQRLAANKVAATISPMATEVGPTLYLVLVGRFESRAEAAAEAARLERELELATAVVPVD